MTHLLERGHGERFTKLMDGFMPDWRSRRDELNGAPLAEEQWQPDSGAVQLPVGRRPAQTGTGPGTRTSGSCPGRTTAPASRSARRRSADAA